MAHQPSLFDAVEPVCAAMPAGLHPVLLAAEKEATPPENDTEAESGPLAVPVASVGRDCLDDLPPRISVEGFFWRGFYLNWDMYYVPEPDEPWSYEIDDFGIGYTLPCYPLIFSRDGQNPEEHNGIYRPTDDEPGAATHTGLRLAPDTAYQAWRTQYAGVYEELHDGRVFLWGHFECTLRYQQGAQGPIGDVLMVNFRAPVDDWSALEINNGKASLAGLPTWMEQEAHRKVEKIRTWYASEQQRRIEGKHPTRAYDRYEMYLARQATEKRRKAAMAPRHR
jgi:hypothetical protein